ncbi:MAG: hypothetical protein KF764_01780 [Labilithrix sp.]|nr:hypothetical protein [Labilithrix sp.]
MKFRLSGPALLIAASTVVVIAITLIAQLMTTRLVATAHAGDYDLMRRAFTGTLKGMEDEASSDAEIFANMPAVRSAFIERDRTKLLGECEGAFKLMEEKYAIDQAQFHTPPGVSFLRLDAPTKFGDDQTGYRPMLAEVHEEKSLRKGVAITKAGPAILGIVPIFDSSGALAGSFEMGLEFGPVLDDLKTAFALEGAVFFQEKQLHDIATDLPGDIITSKNRVGKYIRYHATHPDLAAALVIDRDIEITGPKTYERTVAGVPWGVQLMPLLNYANKQIGVVAIATSFEEDKTLARRALVWQVLAALVSVVLMAGTILIVIRGVIVAPLAAINVRMAALAAGDASRPAEPLTSYCEELETLARCYEHIRTQRRP